MKVTVIKNLNVRVGKPSVNAICNHYHVPGTIIEVKNKLYKGYGYKGIDTWFKDIAGNYLWSGGIAKADYQNEELYSDMWWLCNFKIPDIWNHGITGRGVKIAVLDSGISYPHVDLDLDQELFSDLTGKKDWLDKSGHGTHCIGIIKASKANSEIMGVAYNSTIYVGKISHDIKGDKPEYLVSGIEWAINNKVDIISISKGSPRWNDADLKRAIDNAVEKGILIFAAAGNKRSDTSVDELYYPARFKNVISVGAIDENNRPISTTLNTNDINIYAPGQSILSTHLNNKFERLSGSSQATPYVAGACALALESVRIKNSSINAISIINELLQRSDNTSFGKILNIHKYMFN